MTRFVRNATVLLLVLAMPLAYGGTFQAQSTRALALLATDSAIHGLKDQVDRLPLSPKFNVKQYLDTIHGHDFLLATLGRAQLIGGVRTLDDHTVQVRLDIPGKTVADALIQIAAANAGFSKYSSDFIRKGTQAWSDRVFTATGISSGVAVAGVVAGTDAPPAAVDAAKRSAALGVIERVALAPLPAGRTGRDLTSLGGVSEALTANVLARPVSKVELQEAGAVSVTVSLDRQAIFETLKMAASESGGTAVPQDEAGWSAYREPILAAVPDEIVGIGKPVAAVATAEAVATPAPVAPIVFPTDRPPEWYFKQLDTAGSAKVASSKLLTARAAEVDAQSLLRQQLMDLPLDKSLTLGNAAQRDPRFATVIARAIDRAHVYRVDYLEDGSASVRISTDSRYLWQDLVALSPAR